MTRSRISAGSSRPGHIRVRGLASTSGLARAAAVALLVPAPALAQGLPFNIGDAVRDAQQSQQAAPQPQQVAPLVLPKLAEPQLVLPDKSTLHVCHIAVTGTEGLTVSEEKLRAALAPYEG